MRLEQAKARWVDELPLALWAYRTTFKTATDHTPYSLSFGSEAVIPVELEVPSHRVAYYNPMTNKALLLESLDMIEVKRDEADLRASRHRHQVACYYDRKVHLKTFEPGDLVLKRVFPPSTQLGPRWEGKYTIQRKLDTGAFKITTVDGEEIPRAWNAQHLRRYLS